MLVANSSFCCHSHICKPQTSRGMERFHWSCGKRKQHCPESLQLHKRFALEAIPSSLAYQGLKMSRQQDKIPAVWTRKKTYALNREFKFNLCKSESGLEKHICYSKCKNPLSRLMLSLRFPLQRLNLKGYSAIVQQISEEASPGA